MKRVIRRRRVTRADVAKYRGIREKIDRELPDLLERHEERMTAFGQFQSLVVQLNGDSDDPDHRSDLMPISLPKEADQVVRSEATLGF